MAILTVTFMAGDPSTSQSEGATMIFDANSRVEFSMMPI